MVFIEWWILRRVVFGLLAVGVGTLGLWAIRKKEWRVRMLVQFLSAFVALGGASFSLFEWWAIRTSHIFSAPVYSPNRKMTVRIDDYNGGGFGGAYDSVELFAARGFRSDVVFFGEWNSVETANLHWRSDSELEISYHGALSLCASTPHVQVRCISK
jgi:hypothetical protein